MDGHSQAEPHLDDDHTTKLIVMFARAAVFRSVIHKVDRSLALSTCSGGVLTEAWTDFYLLIHKLTLPAAAGTSKPTLV